MARRTNDEGCLSVLFGFFISNAWWWPFPLALVTYLLCRFLLPLMFSDPLWVGIKVLFETGAPYIAGLVLFTGVLSWLYRLITPGRSLLNNTDSLEDLRALSWRQFEQLVAEVYRRCGYQVLPRGGAQPDGGVDIELRKDGLKSYVQCKHRQAGNICVKVVRELYGVMASDRIDEGIVVTSGDFTEDARDFARHKPITLLNGRGLLALIEQVGVSPQAREKPTARHTNTADVMPPMCPYCGAVMVARTARHGANAGEEFWGCSQFPKCRGTRAMV